MLRSTHYPVEFASIYLQACQNTSEAKRAAIRARIRQIAQEVSETGDNQLVEAYTRHARLLSLVLDDTAIEEGIGLEGNHTSQDLLGPISANGEAGISVITASMNRNENLLRALPSWLRLPEVSEVVIVDWSSKEPVREALKRLPKPDSRIKVARVTNAPRWSAPCAFNAGIRLTKCRRILKLDADIVLSKDFLTVNGIPGENEFIAGNWRNVSDDQQHVNGSFLAPRAALSRIGGYSEFFTTYGWEDDEIYDRLQASGLKRKDVDTTTMLHLPHSDAERTGDTTSGKPSARETVLKSPRFLIQRNRVLTERLPPWSSQMKPLPLLVDRRSPNDLTLSLTDEPASEVPPEIFKQVTEEMLRELMAWDYGLEIRDIPQATFDRVMARPLSDLSKEAFLQAAAATRHPAPEVAPLRRRLFIDAQNGLGNRLRAIGSAAAIADATDCELVIVWQPDYHCDCRLIDLFQYDGPVVERSFYEDAHECDIHNYMPIEGGQKDAPIRTDGSQDIYVRSAFVLNSIHSDWERENRFINSLRPVDSVRSLVKSVRNPNDVAVHVRMEGGRKDEHLPYESSSNWTEEEHDLIDHWRSTSHYSTFMLRLDALATEGRANTIFLAADCADTYDAFIARYGERLACLPRTLYDRSTEQLQYALADAILLGRASLLLGSTWSSFSELALRLAPGKLAHEMSGTDF